MTKKYIHIVFLILFISVFSVVAAPTNPSYISYLMPYNATNGIPMDSPYYWPITKNWEEFNHGDKYTKIEGAYTGYQQIAHGGVRDIPFDSVIVDGNGNNKYDLMIDLKITSPAGLEFVSLSNPHITRPFELYVVMKHVSTYKRRITGDYFSGGQYDPNGYINEPAATGNNFKIVKLDKSGQEISVSFPYRPLLTGEGKDTSIKDEYGWFYPEYVFDRGGMQKIWFDVCIVLPGNLPEGSTTSLADENDRITMPDGKMKQLVIADDYSASVILDMHIYSTDNPTTVDVTQSISIPMRGFYDGSKASSPAKESMVQVSIIPTAACNNLDLMKQQGQYVKIADLNVNTTRLTEKVGKKTEVKEYAKPAYVFLSSSPDPYKKGPEFVLKHRQAPEFGEYNTRNHMKYTVMLYEYGNSDYYQYDGTMAIERGKTAADYKITAPGEPGKPANMNKIAESHVREEKYADSPYIYYALDSELGIIMENKNGLAMIRGAYDSKIYVHVITDDAFLTK